MFIGYIVVRNASVTGIIIIIIVTLKIELPWPSGYELKRSRVLILVKVIGG